MPEKRLSDQIAEGIIKGFWEPLAAVLLGILIGVAVIFLLLMIISYLNHTDTDKCIAEGRCQGTVTIRPSCTNFDWKYCKVNFGNETDGDVGFEFSACGNVEANAHFEQIKPQIQEWLCKSHPTWKIKWLICEG